IISMLDIPIRLDKEMSGVLCHEHVGTPRIWKTEEQNFATAVADRLALRLQVEKNNQVQNKITQSEQELQSLVRSIPDLILILDHKMRFIKYYAPDPKKLFVPPEKFIGRTVSQDIPPALEKILKPALGHVLRRGGCRKILYPVPLGRSEIRFLI